MNERITLRAKSDGTEISGELVRQGMNFWDLRLAPEVTLNTFSELEWDRVYTLPTTPGTVFRATVRDAPNVRVMTQCGGDYTSGVPISRFLYHSAADIDASTVVIELEGDGDE